MAASGTKIHTWEKNTTFLLMKQLADIGPSGSKPPAYPLPTASGTAVPSQWNPGKHSMWGSVKDSLKMERGPQSAHGGKRPTCQGHLYSTVMSKKYAAVCLQHCPGSCFVYYSIFIATTKNKILPISSVHQTIFFNHILYYMIVK
jgi:hypothetical protein